MRVQRVIAVVCGVGHETDISLCDLAADLRAPTPTAAAELAAPARDELLTALATRAAALGQAARRTLDTAAQRLDRMALRLGQPAATVSAQHERLAAVRGRLQRAVLQHQYRRTQEAHQLAQRLPRAMAVALARQAQTLAAQHSRLQALDPHQVLQRGYAWVETAAGQPVVSVRNLQAGQQVQAVWADGRARATIDAVIDVVKPGVPTIQN